MEYILTGEKEAAATKQPVEQYISIISILTMERVDPGICLPAPNDGFSHAIQTTICSH